MKRSSLSEKPHAHGWLLAGMITGVFCGFAETLTWNGGNAGIWDATTANWKTEGGAATAWIEGSAIVVPAGQTVNATTLFSVAGVTLGNGATIGGRGSLLVSGGVGVADGGASLALPVWTGNDCVKTGAGDLAANQLAGAMTVAGGRLLTGRFHGVRGVASESGGTHVTMAADATADDLIANGSFEESATAMATSGYMYVKGDQMPTGWINPSSTLFVRINGTGGNAWNQSTAILDGSFMVGFQRNGLASQAVTVPTDGFYELTYLTCKRSASSNCENHFLEVTVDGVRCFSQMSVWLLSHPQTLGTGPVWLSAGRHVIGFQGEERWGDATTFVDKVQLRACATADAPTAANEVVLTDGAAAPALTAENGISYLTKTGDGICTVADPMTVPGGTCQVSVNGRLAFAGKVTGTSTPTLVKRGPGTVSFTGGLASLGLRLAEGTMEVAGASGFGLRIRTVAGAPATFVMDTAANCTSADTSVLGTGAATVRTTGGAHAFSVAYGGNTKALGLSVPELTFDVGAGDLVQLPYLYQPKMNESTFATDLVKAGAGRLQLTAATPTNVGGTGLAGGVALRDGTLEVAVDDLAANAVHPLTGAFHLYHPVLGNLSRPLQVGDAATPADAVLTVKPCKADFASTRAVNVGAQGASVTFDASALEEGSALFGDVALGRAETMAKGPSAGVLAFGRISRADGFAASAKLTATGSVLIEGCADAGVDISSSGELGFGRTASSPVTVGALDLSGAYVLGFLNGASPTVRAGTLRLGATTLKLVDRVSGGVPAVVGTRTLFAYDTLVGDPEHLLKLEDASRADGYTYAISHDAAAKVIALTVRAASDSPEYTWISPSDASWDVGSAWDHDAAPNAADVFAVFGPVPTAPTTVTLAGERTVGGLTFANVQGYTLTGGALALAPQDGARPVIRVAYGTHAIASAVGTTDGGEIVVEAAEDARLVFDGAVNAPLNVTSGTVGYGVHARVAAGVTTAQGVTTAVDGELTVAGEATLAGSLTGTGRLVKTGAGELSLPTAATASRPFSGTLSIEEGTLKLGAPFLDKATVDLGSASSLTVDPGSHGLLGTFRRAGVSSSSEMLPFCSWVMSLGNFEAKFGNLGLITQEFFDASKSSVFHVLDTNASTPTLPAACRQGGTNPDYWVAVWEGFLTVPESGLYEFSCKPDDAMILAIDRRSVMQSTNCIAVASSVYLEKGPHTVFVGLVEISGNCGLPLNVKRPGAMEPTGLPVAWLSPVVGAKRTVGSGALKPADGMVLTVRQGSGTSTAFTGKMAGDGTGAVVLQRQPDGSHGLFEVSDWQGGIPYLRMGEFAIAAPGRLLEAVGSDYNTGTISLVGARGVKSLSGNSTTALGAHLWARQIFTDDDCGISSDKTYTHLVSFPLTGDTNPPPSVNGVTFDGRGEFDGRGPGAVIRGTTGHTGFKSLFNSFAYGSQNYSFTLKNLDPGKVYDFRFYWMPYGVGGDGRRRIGSFMFSGQDADGRESVYQSYTVDLEAAWGGSPKASFAIIGCRYVAGPDGKMTVTIASESAQDTVHSYAFSNELMSPGTSNGDRMVIETEEGKRAKLQAELNGSADVTVAGDGEQRLAGAVKLTKPLKVAGHLTLERGADVQGVELVGGKLELRGGAKVCALSGEGALDFRWGDPRPFGDLRDDGTYAPLPAFRTVNFTGDDDCGITPSKTYLLALNYRSLASYEKLDYVNEIPFKQVSPSSPDPTAGEMYNYTDMRSLAGVVLVGVPWSAHAGGNDENIGLPAGEGLCNVLHAMVYAANQQDKDLPITIGGLTVGNTYELRFWERMWDAKSLDTRNVTFTFRPDGAAEDETHAVSIDRAGQVSPYYIAFRFKAKSSGYRVTSRSLSNDTWHLYGATIEQVESDVADRAVLDLAEDATVTGPVTGVGMVEKRGDGVLTLAGDAVAAKGFWYVRNGGLLLADAEATLGEVAVGANGSFGGTGRVTDALGVAGGGTLVLEGSLQVGGKLVIGAGANVAVAGGSVCSAKTLVLPANLKIRPTERLSGCTPLFTSESALTGLDTTGWTVCKPDGKGVDHTAKIVISSDAKTVSLATGGTVILVR